MHPFVTCVILPTSCHKCLILPTTCHKCVILPTTCHKCVILPTTCVSPCMLGAVQAKALQRNHKDVQKDSPGSALRLTIEKVSLPNTAHCCTAHTSSQLCAMIRHVTFLRMLVLPSPVLRSEAGEEVRRYLTYITKDKVSKLGLCSCKKTI